MNLEQYVADWRPQPLHTHDPLVPETAARLPATLEARRKVSASHR